MPTVVFVCPHGALKSRLAAAWFNDSAPAGWTATSAGLHPQEEVSVHAAPLLDGTSAAGLLDLTTPRALGDLGHAERLIAIDCEISGAQTWRLTHTQPGTQMRDELKRLVDRLRDEVADGR